MLVELICPSQKQGKTMRPSRIISTVSSVALLVGTASDIGTLQAKTAVSTVHKVVGVVLESGDPQQTLTTGYNTMETATLSCRYSSCTLAMSIMSNIGKSTCTQKEWAIVGLVDGNSVDGGPYEGSVPGNGLYQSRSWQGAYQVSNGKHTIAFQLNVPCPVTAYQWSVNYLLTH